MSAARDDDPAQAHLALATDTTQPRALRITAWSVYRDCHAKSGDTRTAEQRAREQGLGDALPLEAGEGDTVCD